MTRLLNDPTAFADEALEGFVKGHPQYVRRVSGGVIRRTKAPEGITAVVIGGGSGHYPTYVGLVGHGLAHGCVVGNIFASPSAQQVYEVAKAAHRGGGVLLGIGNYAGDVLHFNQAADRLRSEGVDVSLIAVTDDIASASPDEAHKRRGIAGDLAVFKTAGAAADAGYEFQEVVRVAERANERTRSFGVAFDGCTLPGDAEALFHVPQGKMAVGLGIHGEAGISEEDIPTADGLAEFLVARLLNDAPADKGNRLTLLLNGLGTVKYEELFVVYRRVHELLTEEGLQIVEPEIGELCTSLDMAGISLTLFWLDEELEQLWKAPANTPALRKVPTDSLDDAETAEWVEEEKSEEIPEASPLSKQAAHSVLSVLDAAGQTLQTHEAYLGQLDAVAGDGDHGRGMLKGVRASIEAARSAVTRGAGAGTALKLAGQAWSHRAGGTSGALWGGMLETMGAAFGDKDPVSSSAIVQAVEEAVQSVIRTGGAKVGDKTMVDALVPFAAALSEKTAAGNPLAQAWTEASNSAKNAAEATSALSPKLGRARPLAEKSLGSPDPGAVSFSLIVESAGQHIQCARQEAHAEP